MSSLDDVLRQLDEEITDAAIEAMRCKHDGDWVGQKVWEELSAKRRRQHRTLLLKGYYEVTGTVQPDVEMPEVGRELAARLKQRVTA